MQKAGPFDSHRLPDKPLKGRGAISNEVGRFERLSRAAEDDGWASSSSSHTLTEDDIEEPSPRTMVAIDSSRTVLSYNQSPDIPFDRSINPYRGCEHGCIYCFARPTHAYLGLSPGLDFETRLTAKPDAAAILAKELSRPSYRPAVIAMGTNTDPYQPVEKHHRITRAILELLHSCNHPVAITTKSALILRDLDILADMASRRLVSVGVSVTSLDGDLSRRLEPRAPQPKRRLEAIEKLAAAGIPVTVMAAPMIPALTDWEMERIIEEAAARGATGAAYIPLRLPHEIKQLFREWLEAHEPNRADHVWRLVQDIRDGRLNDPNFKTRMRGTGPYADMLRQRFRLLCQRLGLNKRDWHFDLTRFTPPALPNSQLALF